MARHLLYNQKSMANISGTNSSGTVTSDTTNPVSPDVADSTATGSVGNNGSQTSAPQDDRPVEGENLPVEGQNDADVIEQQTRPNTPVQESEPQVIANEPEEQAPEIESRPEYDSQLSSRRDQLMNEFRKKADQVQKGNPDQPETQQAMNDFVEVSDQIFDMQDAAQDRYESREKTQDKQQTQRQRQAQTLSEQQFLQVKRTYAQVKAKSSQWVQTVKQEQGKEAVREFQKNFAESQRRMGLVEARRNQQKQQEKLGVWNSLVQSSAQRDEAKKQKLNLKEKFKYQEEAKEAGADEGVEGDAKLTPRERAQIKKEAESARKAELARSRGVSGPQDEYKKADKKRETEIKKELADLQDEHKGVQDPTKVQMRATIAALRHADKLTKEQADDLLQKIEVAADQAADRMHAGAEAMVVKKENGLAGLLSRAGKLIAKGRVQSEKKSEEDVDEDASTVRHVFERAWEIFSNAGLMQAEQNISGGGGAKLSTVSSARFGGTQEEGQRLFEGLQASRKREFQASPFNHFNHWQSGQVTAGRLRDNVGRV